MKTTTQIVDKLCQMVDTASEYTKELMGTEYTLEDLAREEGYIEALQQLSAFIQSKDSNL